MSAEIIATLVMGVVGLAWSSDSRGDPHDHRGVRQDMAQMETRLVGKIDSLALQLGKLCGRMAYIDGLVAGLAPPSLPPLGRTRRVPRGLNKSPLAACRTSTQSKI